LGFVDRVAVRYRLTRLPVERPRRGRGRRSGLTIDCIYLGVWSFVQST
jgi:hypothetical protein